MFLGLRDLPVSTFAEYKSSEECYRLGRAYRYLHLLTERVSELYPAPLVPMRPTREPKPAPYLVVKDEASRLGRTGFNLFLCILRGELGGLFSFCSPVGLGDIMDYYVK